MTMTLVLRYTKDGKNKSKTFKDQTGFYQVKDYIRKKNLEKLNWEIEVI